MNENELALESVVSVGHQLNVSKPSEFRIVDPDGEPLLTIYGDGRWEFRNEDDAPTEAARVFVQEVRRLTENFDADLIRRAADRLREVLPSFTDPRHYANHSDIALVRDLEALVHQKEQ